MEPAAAYAVLGALTADAASLGLHWLYDTQRLREVIPPGGQSEFLEPRREHYDGYFGYFAHGARRAGDCSHYGESALIMLRSLADSAGSAFSVRRYEKLFREHFGPGGEFCGYIDNATRLTLENLVERDQRAVRQAAAVVNGVPEEVRNTLIGKVIPYTRQFSGEALRGPVERAVRITYDDDALVKLAWEMARTVDRAAATCCGADDDQVSATAKLPALVARYAGDAELPLRVEAAVRVTNNNAEAVAYSQVVAKTMEAALLGAGVKEAIRAGLAGAAPSQRGLLDAALREPKDDPISTVQRLGQTCYVSEAVPVVFYLLHHCTSYTEAIRTNIRVGAIRVGAALSWVRCSAQPTASGAPPASQWHGSCACAATWKRPSSSRVWERKRYPPARSFRTKDFPADVASPERSITKNTGVYFHDSKIVGPLRHAFMHGSAPASCPRSAVNRMKAEIGRVWAEKVKTCRDGKARHCSPPCEGGREEGRKEGRKEGFTYMQTIIKKVS
jgi:hypothetical protein